jgi:hypothetical protein
MTLLDRLIESKGEVTDENIIDSASVGAKDDWFDYSCTGRGPIYHILFSLTNKCLSIL